MSKRINIKNIEFLYIILAQCYLRTGSYLLSINYLVELLKTNPNSSMIYFSLAILYTFVTLSRKNQHKEKTLLIAINLFKKYACLRREFDPIEVEYNLGRFYNFIGLESKAEFKYNKAILSIESSLNKERYDKILF